MLTRPYGNTGIDLSAVGFGGIICTDEELGKAAEIVGKAVDKGVSHLDVAPGYGSAQEILGPALAPYWDPVFLVPCIRIMTVFSRRFIPSCHVALTRHIPPIWLDRAPCRTGDSATSFYKPTSDTGH